MASKVKPCTYCQCQTWFDTIIDKTFTKKDGTVGHGWWREDLTKEIHTRERCDNFKKSKEFMAEQQAVSYEQPKPQVIDPPKVKEMSVADIAEPALRRETLVNLKVLKVIEDEVIKFLGKDTNPAKVGMFMKLVMDMGKKN